MSQTVRSIYSGIQRQVNFKVLESQVNKDSTFVEFHAF